MVVNNYILFVMKRKDVERVFMLLLISGYDVNIVFRLVGIFLNYVIKMGIKNCYVYKKYIYIYVLDKLDFVVFYFCN